MLRRLVSVWVAGAMFVLAGCSGAEPDGASPAGVATGAPGAAATWSNAQKLAIGTSYEAYDENGQYSDASATAPISKVWFSVGQDRITEVMWGLIHEAQIREIRILLAGPDGIVDPSDHSISLAGGDQPTSPMPTLVQIYAEIDRVVRVTTIADPDRDVLLVRVTADETLPDGYRLYAYLDPTLGNTGGGDR